MKGAPFSFIVLTRSKCLISLDSFRGRRESWTNNASMIVLSTLRAGLSIAWGGLLAFDVAVFVLTLHKATRVGYNIPLIQIMVRDGERILITYINE